MGVITIRRTDARPFTDQPVDLLKTVACQAVIAMASQVRTALANMAWTGLVLRKSSR
jgi:hypothetical protein